MCPVKNSTYLPVCTVDELETARGGLGVHFRAPVSALLAGRGEDAMPKRSDDGRVAAISGAVPERDYPPRREPPTGSRSPDRDSAAPGRDDRVSCAPGDSARSDQQAARPADSLHRRV